MKERPILFSGAMVRAILSGAKTQTRRVVKTQPLSWHPPVIGAEVAPSHFVGAATFLSRCPYGVPGDRLWVRETFAAKVPGCEPQRGFSYRADHNDPRGDGPANPMRWTPSIHMPRAASRITLEVTDVRVERLQDISDADAKAEGFPLPNPQKTRQRVTYPDGHVEESIVDGYFFDARQNFCATWEALNGERAPWASNPWVWVVSFRRLP